jgi:hypothetical protein
LLDGAKALDDIGEENATKDNGSIMHKNTKNH